MKRALMDSSVVLGLSGEVDANCAITQRSLSFQKGRETPVEAALVPKHGFELVDTSNQAWPAPDHHIDFGEKGKRHGTESSNTPPIILQGP